MIKRALISVSDKQGIVEFATALHGLGVEIISTGGTSAALEKAGIPVTKISEVTEFPEMMDGRVKTLHPRIHGGLLALRENTVHMKQAGEHGIGMIDLVAVNLYPFEETIAAENVTLEKAIENIDIGGPSMIRSAAKNYRHVVVLVEPADYQPVLEELKASGTVGEQTRYRLMVKAFEHTGRYDGIIASYFGKSLYDGPAPRLSLSLSMTQPLRYGENPHQQAAFYGAAGQQKLYKQLHGKELSYNNIIDLDACTRVVMDFDAPCCVIVKHTNPCGIAVHANLREAYENARATDPVSAFGGVIGFNRLVDGKTAKAISEVFVEAVIAPDFDDDATEILSQKKNIRLITYDFMTARKLGSAHPEVRKALDGYLVQQTDDHFVNFEDDAQWKVVTRRQPTTEEWDSLIFGWRVVKHVKSNAIVYSSKDRTLGIGAGQMSRVDSSEIAVAKSKKAGLTLKGSAIASDAFFPFRDGVDAAAAAGATAVVQPGGSVKDQEVIDAANEHDMTMVFTSIRHFKH